MQEIFLGVNSEPVDPSVAIVKDGKVLAYAEEERFIRNKHANGVYPIHALEYCLDFAGVSIRDITNVAVAWNLPHYTDGTIKSFYESLRNKWPVDSNTLSWQSRMLQFHDCEYHHNFHRSNCRRVFGDINFPPLYPLPHHYVHAFHSFMQSRFEKAVCITIDGSGDKHCTVIWHCEGNRIQPIREIFMPHSLGWFYAAFTEYLGFRAYDGEYKVMGLAAYGRPDSEILSRMKQIIYPADDGVEYLLDPSYIYYGPHTYSNRFTDKMVELFGRKPRLHAEKITEWHEDLAFAVQKKLEDFVERLILWAIRETGVNNICIGGGVGLNIKMNSRIFQLPDISDVFAHPLCNDAGTAVGAALAACFQTTNKRPEILSTLALGPDESDDKIENTLKRVNIKYEKSIDICEAVAEELVNGRIIGWFQGRMEAGPRALGQRSILADPRYVENRDKVNAIIKFREYWRPFCPSVTEEAMNKYFEEYTESPFMIVSFKANDRLKSDAPAIVHIDGTSRVQMVKKDVLPLYYKLITAFEKRTGVPVLLNTSFNIKGEPIVCTIQDALRTFWSTGLDVLAIGNCLINKHKMNIYDGSLSC
jgi:carbamoyltransferase